MGLLEPIISSLLSFFAGIVITKISLNGTYDRERCTAVIALIEAVVVAFHERFDNTSIASTASAMMFDYQVKSLVDDTTLLPIIGRRCFEEEYTETIGKIFKLSLDPPLNMSQAQKLKLTKSMNNHAVDLKKIINTNEGTWRFSRRR
jgi:hypothetical protein